MPDLQCLLYDLNLHVINLGLTMRRNFSIPNENDSFNVGVFKQVLPFLVEYRLRILFAFLCLVLAKVASVYLPFVLKYTVDTLNQESANPLLLMPLGLIAGYGLLRLANVVFAELRDLLFGRVTERAMRRIGLKVFSHIHALDLSFHLSRKTGGLARDIERGVTGISFIMRFLVFNIGPTLIELCFVIGILWFNYGVIYALVILIAVACYVFTTVKVTNWRIKFIREANLADNQSNTRAVDSLLNFETVKYFNNEKTESDYYDKDLAQWERARRKNRLSLFALNGGQATIIALAMTAMLLLAAIDVQNNIMTIGDFVLVNAFMMQIFIPLNFLGFVYREIKGSLTNIENMFALLNEKAKVIELPEAPNIAITTGDITFSQVDFGYTDNRQVISDLSFTVKGGTKVAIVGASGAGKSSLTKLLFRFYDVTGGSIQIDGQDIAHVSLSSLRKAIGVVPQDTVLFNASIYDNVHYGNLNATKDQVYQAIKDAQLAEFVNSLPDKYDTQVGERGLKLSGGEKQRVAIARTLLKQSTILVFDEATSSLDSHNEASIMHTLNQIAQSHTTLVIAHRLSTITDADLIVYLDKGQVVEQGTHQTLLDLQGHYARLWQAQAK